MRVIIWTIVGLILLFSVSNSYLSSNLSYAGTLSSYALQATLQSGDKIPIVVAASGANGNINWYSLQALTTSAINWTNLQLVQQSSAGVNWTFLDPNTGGINWYKVSDQATSTNIACWKSNGQLGKCITSISGVNCTTCG